MSDTQGTRRGASGYAAAAVFLVLFTIGGIAIAVLSPHEANALRLWASTKVANLQHHPVPALAVSAFLPSGWPFAWLVPIALTMFAANRAIGTARLALICAVGHLTAMVTAAVLGLAQELRPRGVEVGESSNPSVASKCTDAQN